jgi:hypothetical protein
LEPETKPSLSARISVRLQRLHEILASFWASLLLSFSKMRSPRHSVNPILSNPSSENKPTQDTERESTKETNHPESPVPIASTTSKSQPPQTHYKIAYKTEKNWWDKAKPYVECAGVILLAIYTGFTVAMYFANEKAADAADRAARAAETSVGIAQTGVDNVIKQSQLDQRAWIGIESIGGIPDIPETNKSFAVITKLRNSGKTPAKNILTRFEAYPLPNPPNVNLTCDVALKKQESKTLLPPNGIFSANLIFGDGKPLGQGWELGLKNKRIYAYGCVLYDDIFDRSHWLTYCGVLDFPSKSFQACKHHNDTGDGYAPQ